MSRSKKGGSFVLVSFASVLLHRIWETFSSLGPMGYG